MVTRVILTAGLLVLPFFSEAYPASADKQMPVAQVYEVQGKATVKSMPGGSTREVEKGSLVGMNDSLILENQASVVLYFKTGGKKEVRAKDTSTVFRVTDILPQPQAYAQSVPVFGATRGRNIPETGSPPAGFFYPQEAVIIDTAPLIEFTVFSGPGGQVVLSNATVQILHNGKVLDVRKFDSLESGAPGVYQPPKLKGQTDYTVELRLELEKTLGTVLTVSFPLYIAAASDTASKSKYGLFSDAVYRSVESASVDLNGTKRSVTLIKQVVRRSGSPEPVIAIELFIP